MLISIITSTYNSATTVRDTLSSISEQSYKNIDHIIVDGLSKDNTLEIVKEFDHVSQVISESDKGIYDAMNKGVKLAKGEIVGILNSDDFYANDMVLSDIMEIFQNKEVDAVYGNLQYVDAVETNKVVRTWMAGDFKKSKFLNGWMPPHPTFFVRKSVYDKYGLFDSELKCAADYEIMIRFLYKYGVSVQYLDKTLVMMRTGGISNASLSHRLFANREDKLAWKKNNLTPKFYTTYLKPIRKIPQFFGC